MTEGTAAASADAATSSTPVSAGSAGSAPSTSVNTPLVKRNRLTLVCQTCKRRKVKCDRVRPTCSTCTKTGAECVYKPLSKGPVISKTQSPSLETILNTPPDESVIDPAVSRSGVDLHRLTKKELIEALEKLNWPGPFDGKHGNEINKEVSTSSTPADDIAIDFYDKYSSLSFKQSSHEDSKPLNPLSLHKRDAYYLFYISYLLLNLRVADSSSSGTFKQDWKSKHLDGISKWILLLDTQRDDKDLREPIKKIISGRAQLFKNSSGFAPLTQTSDESSLAELKPEIIKLLPKSKQLLNEYLAFFTRFILPLRPIIDIAVFQENVQRIVNYNDNGEITIRLEQRHDLAIIASLLIILRYSTISVEFSKSEHIPEEFENLKNHPTSIRAITIAQLCLSFYKVLRKSTIEILQALLFLRYYHRDCPEDGDGINLLQSENLFGIILQSALNMGLNREVSGSSHDFKESERNLRRRIWYAIVEIHSRTTILGGSISILPNLNTINVDGPFVSTVDALERAQRDEILQELHLSQIYIEISNLINDVTNHTSLSKLEALISQSKKFIEEKYNLMELTPLSKSGTPKSNTSVSYRNLKIYTKQVTQLVLENQVYSSILLYLETTQNIDIKLYSKIYLLLVQGVLRLTDLATSYVLGDLDDMLPSTYSYEINPLLNTSIFRISYFAISQLIRIYHSQDLVQKNVSDQSLSELAVLLEKFHGALLIVSKQLAKGSHLALKLYAPANSGFKTLINLKGQLMKKVIKLLSNAGDREVEGSGKLTDDHLDEIQERFGKREDLLKSYNEWVPVRTSGTGIVGKSSDSIINTKAKNVYILLDQDTIEATKTMLQIPFVFAKSLGKLIEDDVYLEYLRKNNSFNVKSNLSQNGEKSILNNDEFELDFSFLDEMIKSIQEGTGSYL